MSAVTVRDVPDDALAELKLRAARQGRSLQEFLRGTLIDLARRPDIEVVLERAAERHALTGVTLDRDTVADDLAADRR